MNGASLASTEYFTLRAILLVGAHVYEQGIHFSYLNYGCFQYLNDSCVWPAVQTLFKWFGYYFCSLSSV